jgi:hypothetical protein
LICPASKLQAGEEGSLLAAVVVAVGVLRQPLPVVLAATLGLL